MASSYLNCSVFSYNCNELKTSLESKMPSIVILVFLGFVMIPIYGTCRTQIQNVPVPNRIEAMNKLGHKNVGIIDYANPCCNSCLLYTSDAADE